MSTVEDKPERLKTVHCTWATGIGGGVARFDAYLNRFLDRDLFSPKFVVTKKQVEGELMFDGSMRFEYTGDRNRFNALLDYFRDADIVTFQGGFDPLVCEAAKSAGVRALVEVIHTIEQGGLYKNIDMTVCVSKTVFKQQSDKTKAMVIYNGIDLADFHFRGARKSDGKIVVLQAANREKALFNIDQLADELLAIDPRIELWLAGGGQEGRSTDRIKFFGLQADIEKLYQRADILAMFTKREAFGLAVIEAMACGVLPVVINKNGPAEIVRDDENGWIARADAKDDLITALKEAVKTHGSGRWEKMRLSARESVEKNFTARHCIRSYEKLFLELIEKKGRREQNCPISPAPSPEVDLADALFHLKNNRTDDFVEAFIRLGARQGNIKTPLCAYLTHELTKQTIAQGLDNIAFPVLKKLTESGFLKADWMEGLLKTFLDSDPANPEYIMLSVNHALATGRGAIALKIMEKGVRLNPKSDELGKTYELLKRKLS